MLHYCKISSLYPTVAITFLHKTFEIQPSKSILDKSTAYPILNNLMLLKFNTCTHSWWNHLSKTTSGFPSFFWMKIYSFEFPSLIPSISCFCLANACSFLWRHFCPRPWAGYLRASILQLAWLYISLRTKFHSLCPWAWKECPKT